MMCQNKAWGKGQGYLAAIKPCPPGPKPALKTRQRQVPIEEQRFIWFLQPCFAHACLRFVVLSMLPIAEGVGQHVYKQGFRFVLLSFFQESCE